MPDDGSCELKHVAQYYVTLKCWAERCNYVGHLENKERLRIQPAQLFNFS